MKKKFLALSLCVPAVLSPLAFATNFKQTGTNLTYGSVSHGQGYVSNVVNPASAAYDRTFMRDEDIVKGAFSIGAGLEYGNLDELFDKIDELSNSIDESDDGGGGDTGGGSDVGGPGSDLDIADPDLEALIGEVDLEVGKIAGVLALVATEGYAKAEVNGKFSAIINHDFAGGTLSFNVVQYLASAAVGIYDPVEFDRNIALSELEAAFDLQESDPITTYDLSGGLNLTVNPANGDVSFSLDNDSLLLTKAAEITEIAFGYSRQMSNVAGGDFYYGVNLKAVEVGLTNIASRFGDITDSESIFEDIENAEFRTDSGFDMDIGVLWVTPNFRLGASVLDVLENKYRFQELDTSNLQSAEVIATLNDLTSYQSKRQIKLEGGLYTQDLKWSLNAQVDANEVEDPLGQEYQWISLSAGYKIDNFILSNVRIGAHSNLASSELTQIGFGLTMFKYVNLDLATTLETTKIDGDEYPRSVGISMGINYKF